MAYTAANHVVFSNRIDAWVKQLQDSLDEFARLDMIYLNETGSGSDGDYVDTDNGTAAEHTDVITLGRALVAFAEGDAVATLDRRPIMSPFLQ